MGRHVPVGGASEWGGMYQWVEPQSGEARPSGWSLHGAAVGRVSIGCMVSLVPRPHLPSESESGDK